MDDTYSTALRWPQSPDEFIDTARCPACFTPVATPRCAECDLELTDPRLATVLLLSRKVHTAEIARRRTLRDVRAAQLQDAVERDAERIRAQQRSAKAAPAALVSPPPTAPPESPSSPAPASGPALSPSPAPLTDPVRTPAAPTRAARTRPRLSVPVLLLVIGVCLVGIAAIFFLTVAWFVASIEVRALIIGGITALTLVTASMLRRRKLEATAEAIAVIGVVLLALDAWAVRANALLGAETLSATLYAGVATLAVSVIARLWSWLSALRAPDVASVIGVPVGLALVVGGAVELPVGPATVLALVAAGAAGLTHTLPAPWSAARPGATAERTALASIGVAALSVGALTSPFVAPGDVWFAVWCTALVVAVAAAYTLVLRRPVWGAPLSWAAPLRSVAAGVGVAAMSAFGWQLALRDPSPVFVSVCGPVIAVAAVVVVLRVRSRAAIPPAALVTAVTVGALSATAATLIWLYDGMTTIALTWQVWATDPVRSPVSVDAYAPLVGAALVAALLWAVPAGAARVVRTGRLTVASTLILAAAGVTAVPLLIVGVAALVCAASAVQGRGLPREAWGWAAPAALGASVGYAAGLAAPWLWLGAVSIALATALVLATIVRTSATTRASLVVVAVAVAAVSAVVAPHAIGAVLDTRAGAGLAAFALLQWISLITLAAAIVAPVAALEGLLRRVLAVAGLAVAALSLVPTALTALPAAADIIGDGPVADAIGEPWAGLFRGAALLAALATIAWTRVRGGFRGAVPAVAALLLAPTAGAVIIAVCDIVDAPDAAPPLATAAFALLCLGSAIAALRGATAAVGGDERARGDAVAHASASASSSRAVRLAADTGTLLATALVAWQARIDLAWLVLLLISAAVASVSITRGWAAPRSAAIATVPTVRSAGALLHAAPRRVLVWPAFGFVVAALWAGLAEVTRHGATPSLEAYTVAPAVGLVALAAAMTWLRRHAEAATATALAVLFGVGASATWLAEYAPARTIIATLVAAGLTIAFGWTPVRRLSAVSVAGAASAVVVTSAGALMMSQWTELPHAAWAAMPAVAAFAAAVGYSRTTDASRAQRRFVTAAPAATILLGSLAVAYLEWWRETTITGAIALAVLLGLSVVAAAVATPPLSSATRVSALAGASLIAATLLPQVRAVELVSLPLALALLAGAALAMRRRARAGAAWPAAESTTWLVGLIVAALPSLVATPTAGRSWLLVAACLLAATGVASIAARPTAALASASVAVLITAVGIAALRALFTLPDPAGLAVPLVAGAGIAAVGAVTVWRRLEPPALSVAAAAAGSTIIALTVGLRGAGDTGWSLVAALAGGAAALVSAGVLARPGWRRYAGTLSIGATAVALTAVGLRVWRLVADDTSGLQPDVWILGGCALVIAVGLVALHSDRRNAEHGEPHSGAATSGVVSVVVGVAFASVAAVAAVAECLLIATSTDGTLRAASTSALLSAAAFYGALRRERIGAALVWAASAGIVLVAVTAISVGAADPIEAVTLPPAIALLLLGPRRLRRDAAVRTWPALGPGLALLTVPSLAQDLGPNELWRIVALGVVAVCLVVLGATRRLQAPLVIGAVVLLAHAVAQLWPWISTSYSAVPWWLWVGLGGILLIVIAARYERQLAALRTAYSSVTSLR